MRKFFSRRLLLRNENDTLPLAAAVRSYAMTPLQSEPGTHYQYSNAGINTAARIIEVVTDMKYEVFMQQRLFDPLGMKDTTFWPNAEQSERVAKEGQWTHDDATVLLIAIYKKEKRYAEALALSRELQEKYPRNYLFRLETADSLVSQAAIARQAGKTKEADAMEGEALSTFEMMLHERPAAGAAPRALDLIHFRYGEALLLMGRPQNAAGEFLAATIVKGADAGTVTRAHLRAAQAFDLAGKRNEALAEYRVVLSRPNVYDSYDQARRGEREAYKATNRK